MKALSELKESAHNVVVNDTRSKSSNLVDILAPCCSAASWPVIRADKIDALARSSW